MWRNFQILSIYLIIIFVQSKHSSNMDNVEIEHFSSAKLTLIKYLPPVLLPAFGSTVVVGLFVGLSVGWVGGLVTTLGLTGGSTVDVGWIVDAIVGAGVVVGTFAFGVDVVNVGCFVVVVVGSGILVEVVGWTVAASGLLVDGTTVGAAVDCCCCVWTVCALVAGGCAVVVGFGASVCWGDIVVAIGWAVAGG